MKLDINKILRATPRNSRRGAPMGDTDHIAYPACVPPLRCQRIQLVDGDYGPDGTYWGASAKAGHVYCAFNDGQDDDIHAPAMGVRLYTRAHTAKQARENFRKDYPVTFVRGGR